MHYHHTFNFKVKCIFAKSVPPSYPVSSIVKSEKTSTSVFPDVKYKFSSVQLLSHVRLFATPWTATCQAFLPITNSLSLLKFMSIESVIPSNHLILCHPFLLLPSIFPSITVFSNESVFASVAEVLEFQLQYQSSQWIFRVDFLYNGMVWSPCCPRDSQESSPTPQFKSINSSTLGEVKEVSIITSIISLPKMLV